MKFKRRPTILLTCLILAILALGALYGLQQAQATTGMPGYDIVLSSQDAPAPGRPAPYGQWIITHNSVTITTTENYGTVAKTAGYDALKTLICYNSGGWDAYINLYARTSSTGNLYPLAKHLTTVPTATQRLVYSFTWPSPWLTIGITTANATTGTTMLCGIYVQTP